MVGAEGIILNFDLDEFEAKAKAATPGLWEVGAGGSMRTFVSIHGDDRCIADIKVSLNDDRDAAYIASMHPGPTLALIERIRELEAKIREPNERGEDAAEFAVKMKAANTGDTEEAHCEMDDLLCAKLRDLGYCEAVDIFEKTDKWYA